MECVFWPCLNANAPLFSPSANGGMKIMNGIRVEPSK